VAGKTAKVDVNRADRDEIGRLPGMTAQTVDRIIQNRPYRKLDELVSKRVIGKKQFAEIREYIVVGPNGS
jgi:DNA uptake protein ComE-like DNA-binding protein